MSDVRVALIVLGLACFAAFSWAVKGHFRSSGTMPMGMRVISMVSLAGFFWFIWRLAAGQVSAYWPVALILLAAALAIFYWAVRFTRQTRPTLAFADDPPSFLLRDGPYHYVRHPFYLAYMLFWTSTAIATAGWLPWLAPAVMLGLYTRAATREEQKFARSDFANAYAAYRARVGMFLPRPRGLMAT